MRRDGAGRLAGLDGWLGMKEDVKSWRDPRVALVVVVAVALWVPFSRLEWFWGHEQASYILRTVEWVSELKAGVLYPRWCTDFYGGYGSPLFIFYGPVIYGIAGFFAATFTDVIGGLKIVILLGSLCSGLGAYGLALGETRDRDAALLASMAFLAAPYRIGNVYARGDLGEYSCLALLPVVLAVYRASSFEARPARARRLLVCAVVLHALLIMTHPVLGLWGSLIIGLVVVATALELVFWGLRRRALELVALVPAAPCLAGLYILPALFERKGTRTAAMIINFYNPQNHWNTLNTFFEPGIPLFTPNFLMIGQLVAVAAVAVAICLLFGRRLRARSLGWFALCAGLVALNLRQMSWFWAPGRLPLVEFIQFPWRLLGPAALAACVALGVAAAALWRKLARDVRFSAAIIASGVLFFWLGWPFISTTEMKTAAVPRDPNAVRQAMVSATDANEYLPATAAAIPSVPERKLVDRTRDVDIDYAQQDGSRQSLLVRSKRRNGLLSLNIHAFPGWQVRTVDGPAEVRLATDERGLLQLGFPKTGRYEVNVWFGASPAGEAGNVLTLVTALVLGLLLAPWPPWQTLARLVPARVRRLPA